MDYPEVIRSANYENKARTKISLFMPESEMEKSSYSSNSYYPRQEM